MNNNIERIVGKQLMLLRKEKGYSIEELAKISKIAPSTISRYENSRCSMNLNIISKLVACLNSDDYIFFDKCVAILQSNK